MRMPSATGAVIESWFVAEASRRKSASATEAVQWFLAVVGLGVIGEPPAAPQHVVAARPAALGGHVGDGFAPVIPRVAPRRQRNGAVKRVHRIAEADEDVLERLALKEQHSGVIARARDRACQHRAARAGLALDDGRRRQPDDRSSVPGRWCRAKRSRPRRRLRPWQCQCRLHSGSNLYVAVLFRSLMARSNVARAAGWNTAHRSSKGRAP